MGLSGREDRRTLGAPCSAQRNSHMASRRSSTAWPEVAVLLSLLPHPIQQNRAFICPSGWASMEKTLLSPLYVQGRWCSERTRGSMSSVTQLLRPLENLFDAVGFREVSLPGVKA